MAMGVVEETARRPMPEVNAFFKKRKAIFAKEDFTKAKPARARNREEPIMINTNELKIGNIILYNGEPIAVKGVMEDAVLLDEVERRAIDGVHKEYQPILANDSSLEPFPLNDFLLEQMGKGKHPLGGIKYHHSGSTFLIYSDNDGYFIGIHGQDRPSYFTPGHFWYLHQLQNVHYAQYGEEIDVDVDTVKRAYQLAVDLNKI